MKLLMFVCVAVQLIIVNSKTLPDLTCRLSDPNLKSCVLKQIQKVIPYLTTGIPEYKILPVDPLDAPYVIFNRVLNEQFVLNAVLKNARIVGFSQVSVEDLKIDPENLVVDITLKHPWFTLATDFKFNGKIAGADMEMQAVFKGNFTDVTNHFNISFKPIHKNGVKYYAVENFKLNGTIEHADLDIIEQNSLDKSLVDFLLNTFKQNERPILDLFAPLYGDTMGDVLRSVLERALTHVPADRLLIE